MIRRWVIPALVLLALAVTPALALGPVDGEFGAVYWLSDTEISNGALSSSFGSEDIGLHGKLWITNWGFAGSIYKAKIDEPGMGSFESTFTSLDFRRKLIAPTENNYLALGFGWQKVEFDDGGSTASTSGLRLSAEGRIGLVGMVYLYGEGAYYLSMDDFDADVVDPQGWESEFGISIKPAPFINFRAGYRRHSLDFDQQLIAAPTVGGSIKPSGFLAGVSVNF